MISSCCKTSLSSWQWSTIHSSPRISFDLGSSLSANMLDLEEAAEKSEVFNAGRRQSKTSLILITTFSHFPPLHSATESIETGERCSCRDSRVWRIKQQPCGNYFWKHHRLLRKALEGGGTSRHLSAPWGTWNALWRWQAGCRHQKSRLGGERESTLAESLCFTHWRPKSNIHCCTEAPLQRVVWSSPFKKTEAHVNRNPLAVSICSPERASFHYR